MAKLTVLEGPDAGNEYELDEASSPLTAGRDPQAEIALTDTAVSRRHFRLEAAGHTWRLVDLESRNQTFLNSSPIGRAVLRHKDLVRAGDTELRFEAAGAPVESSPVRSTIIKEVPAALKRNSIVERLDNLERALEREGRPDSLDRARKILEIYAAVGPLKSSRELLEKLVAEITPLLDADQGAILLRGEGGDGTWVVAAAFPVAPGDEPESRREGGVRISRSVIEKVAGEGKAILSADAPADDRFEKKESIVSGGIASVVAGPITSCGRVVGVLYVDRRGNRPPFTEPDLETLAAAAEPAGAILEKVTAQEALQSENRNLYRSLSESKRIIGRSEAIRGVLEFVRKAAPAPMTVLIQGETGTGKELVAAAIHYSSPRRGGPFVAINCAALPENLVESELFGHERGAFTGAATRRKGRFELAAGGTVFLDEVAELSLACQAKLLRLLEEKTFERVGGTEHVRVDVRVVAATNKKLQDTVQEGAFREDLYYRLNVLAISVPPLRERVEDIELLAKHFLNGCGGGTRTISSAAIKKLTSYDWPGNVRQLRNVVESAVVLGEGSAIQPRDIVLPQRGAPRESEKRPTAQGTAAETDVWKPISLQDLEKIHVRRVLDFTGGNKKRAAEILGIERCTLYSKIKNYGL